MKIKCDFVTNSSSTSYCMYGKCFDKDELKEMLRVNLNEEDDDFYITDFIYELDKEIEVMDLDDSIIVGVSPDKMKENQTLKEFKMYTAEQLKKIGIDVTYNEINLEYGEYYDG